MNRIPLIAVLLLSTLRLTGDCDVIRSLREESRGYSYLSPDRRELKIAVRLFEHLLRGERNLARISPLCREIDLDLILLKDGENQLLVLTEIESARRGRGFYVFRRGRPLPVLLQMPHTFHDLHTGDIGERLFLETNVAVAAWNTVTRSGTLVDGGDPADLAHLDVSYLQALTVAFARVHPEGLVLQLHGFSRDKRTTVEGKLADIVVSNGTRAPDRRIKMLASCLGDQLSVSPAVYPRDIAELGGTTNAQSKLLLSLGHRGFVHLELSLDARRRLSSSEQDRHRFWQCFQERSR